MSMLSNSLDGRLVSVNSGLYGLEKAVVPMGSEVKKVAAPGSVQSRVGTLWLWSSYHIGVHGHRAVTLSPALHKLHSTAAFASCTLPGTQNIYTSNITYKKYDYSSSMSSTMKVNTSLVCAADSKLKYFLNCIKVTCSTACKQLQSWACKLSTDSKGSRWSNWSWWSARWGLSPLLKLSSASCRREAFLWASSSDCLALSASMANLAAWACDSSASAFNAAQDYNRNRV